MKLSSLTKSVVLGAALLSTSVFANANKRIVLEMGRDGTHLRGQQMLPLKRMIKAQHPNLRLERFEIVRVRVVGKSKQGQGTVSLSVGQRQSRSVRLSGQPGDFRVNAPYTWDRRVIDSPANRSAGKTWRLHTQGNIKIKRIAVVLDRGRVQPPRRGIQASCVATLETIWGTDLNKFYITASGQNQRLAKANACAQAMQKCLRQKRGKDLLKCSAR